MQGGTDGMHWASMLAYQGSDRAADQGFLLCIDSLYRHVKCTKHVVRGLAVCPSVQSRRDYIVRHQKDCRHPFGETCAQCVTYF